MDLLTARNACQGRQKREYIRVDGPQDSTDSAHAAQHPNSGLELPHKKFRPQHGEESHLNARAEPRDAGIFLQETTRQNLAGSFPSVSRTHEEHLSRDPRTLEATRNSISRLKRLASLDDVSGQLIRGTVPCKRREVFVASACTPAGSEIPVSPAGDATTAPLTESLFIGEPVTSNIESRPPKDNNVIVTLRTDRVPDSNTIDADNPSALRQSRAEAPNMQLALLRRESLILPAALQAAREGLEKISTTDDKKLFLKSLLSHILPTPQLQQVSKAIKIPASLNGASAFNLVSTNSCHNDTETEAALHGVKTVTMVDAQYCSDSSSREFMKDDDNLSGNYCSFRTAPHSNALAVSERESSETMDTEYISVDLTKKTGFIDCGDHLDCNSSVTTERRKPSNDGVVPHNSVEEVSYGGLQDDIDFS